MFRSLLPCVQHVKGVWGIMTFVARDVAVVSSEHAVVNSSNIQKKSLYSNGLKRALDIFFIVLGAPFVVPVVLVAALLAAMDGHSPLYCQQRVGRAGRTFKLWKLRTMVIDADAKLEAYLASNPEARAEWNRDQKLKYDPRITYFGRILRKSSLDELPQLFNVLTGDMSIVGPRPMMTNQTHLYDGQGYFKLRPGLTGSWQVSDRNACSFAERARFDDDYYKTISFWGDLRIMVQTVGVVLRGTGC